jgi:hypothetical protein
MAKIPPPAGKGQPPEPPETVGNLEKGEFAYLTFRVTRQFKKEFNMYAVEHDYPNQEKLLYEAFEALKDRKA